ncbi:MAG: ABC transporter permease subunit, partial [Vicinamibacterales bacterium]
MAASIVNGSIVGAGYALVALGIVLIYKATRQFNFAQGEFGTVATFVAWMLLNRGLGWPLAGTIAVLTGVAMGLAVERFVVRPLTNSPQVTVLVATAGVALLA